MIKADTLEQFYILQWLEQYFMMDSISIHLVDRYSVRIKDTEGKTGLVTYVEKNNITLEKEQSPSEERNKNSER